MCPATLGQKWAYVRLVDDKRKNNTSPSKTLVNQKIAAGVLAALAQEYERGGRQDGRAAKTPVLGFSAASLGLSAASVEPTNARVMRAHTKVCRHRS